MSEDKMSERYGLLYQSFFVTNIDIDMAEVLTLYKNVPSSALTLVQQNVSFKIK